MSRRILSVILSVCLLLSACFVFTGCDKGGGKDFPVSIGNVTIKQEPKNIVVLNDCLADVISYIGYDVKMVGKSTSCDQEFLEIVPAVGSSENPDISLIKAYEADLVISDSTLSADARQKLEDEKITVITLQVPQSKDELESLYSTLGTALGGNVTGKNKGEMAYSELFETLKSFETSVSKSIIKTVAYLYMNESGQLCTFTKGSLQDELLKYTSAVNIFTDQTNSIVDRNQLKMGTPTFIFYDNENVLNDLNGDMELSNMSALNEGRVHEIPLKNFYRYGTTYENTLYEMMTVMYLDEATPDEESTTISAESATQTKAEATTVNVNVDIAVN